MTITTGSVWENKVTGTVVVVSGIKAPGYVCAEYIPENENYMPMPLPVSQWKYEYKQLCGVTQEDIDRIQIEDKALDAIVKEAIK